MVRRRISSVLLAMVVIFLGTQTPVLALGGPQLPLNESAPNFTLPTNTGDGEISLSDYRGQWVVLYFYPKDFTPGCTLEARRFQQALPKYEAKNTQILGVRVVAVDSHRECCDAEGLKFPLLADTTGKVSKIYGSFLTGMSLRHTYLIDPDGILKERFLGVRPAIHSQEILAYLEQVRS